MVFNPRLTLCALTLAAFAFRIIQLLPDERGWENSLRSAAEAESVGADALAESHYVKALEAAGTFDSTDPRLAATVARVADFYLHLQDTERAERLYRRAAALFNRIPDSGGAAEISCLSSLAGIQRSRGQLHAAEVLYRRAATVARESFGDTDPTYAACLNNLGLCSSGRGRYVLAEHYFRKAQEINEVSLTPDHPALATGLNNIARALIAQRKWAEAEQLGLEALSRAESDSTGELDAAVFRANLATLYRETERFAQAEALLLENLRALGGNFVGAGQAKFATSLSLLGAVQLQMGRIDESIYTLRGAVDLLTESHGRNHVEVGKTLNSLALAYASLGLHADASPLFRESIDVLENTLGIRHPDLAGPLENYALHLAQVDRSLEAAVVAARAKDLRIPFEEESGTR